MSDVHIVWHQQSVSRADREKLNGHGGCVVWFTGLSGCGKSTVSNLVDHKLHALGVHSYVLDGDNVRHGLNAPTAAPQADLRRRVRRGFELGFGAEDRTGTSVASVPCALFAKPGW
jgi:adenylylsulfate kinase